MGFPGWIPTALHLAGDESRMVTGQILPVAGGVMIHSEVVKVSVLADTSGPDGDGFGEIW
jgi:hypothetical protein